MMVAHNTYQMRFRIDDQKTKEGGVDLTQRRTDVQLYDPVKKTFYLGKNGKQFLTTTHPPPR